MKRYVCPVLLLMLVLAGARTANAQTCDRACLRTALDQYLAAIVKHDPTSAPLVLGYRHTENALNKYLPALRVRPVGQPLASTARTRTQYDPGGTSVLTNDVSDGPRAKVATSAKPSSVPTSTR